MYIYICDYMCVCVLLTAVGMRQFDSTLNMSPLICMYKFFKFSTDCHVQPVQPPTPAARSRCICSVSRTLGNTAAAQPSRRAPLPALATVEAPGATARPQAVLERIMRDIDDNL